MVNSTDFAKRIEKILDYYSLSATAFSEAIDFNRSTISHLISGRNKPSLEFVMKVVQKFPEVELYWLLNGKGVFPSEENISNSPSASISRTTKTESSNLLKVLQKETETSQLSQRNSEEKQKEIDKIVIFYKDGSFKAYEN
ncbi:helix-turn-helix domain-containing protein [Cochleicola gelatinilyticus]|uniref:DNA-binding protein n=1 Tax=Cochleicola gelatinilyticus TaxID=1763537 RepID=A0A167H151_9FLAO|nr:helix-turn-helix transcriptional regulator [Cochleicola gelatinilyticus]OAB78103.1 DNA-binding protein [Cochleicola gelatinilyticus]